MVVRTGDQLVRLLQLLMPQHLVSRLVRWGTRRSWAPWRLGLIRWFARAYEVDMCEAAQPQLHAYATFNDFFTRALRANARPVAAHSDSIVSPVDGTVYTVGDLNEDTLLQAKGQPYSVQALLGRRDDAAAFYGGHFVTLYLSPRDYHRVHMPLTGRLLHSRHVPGRLFSVNPRSARVIPGLFARNERVVALFDTRLGRMAVILVGAMCVGCMETAWQQGPVTSDFTPAAAIHLVKGQELARFNMGSTVIVLFPARTLQWRTGLAPGGKVRCGEEIAKAC